MENEKELVDRCEAFVHSVMDSAPSHLRDVDIIALCGFLVSAYSTDQEHAKRLLVHVLLQMGEYYEKLARGELGETVH